MIISKCPKRAIVEAAQALDLRFDITALSPTGLRHQVKLYPSCTKVIKVEAGTRIFYSRTIEQRAILLSAYKSLNLVSGIGDTLIRPEDFNSHNFPTLPAPLIAQAAKLVKLILGTERTTYKKITHYQRKSPHSERAICAVCWHGFRDFFLHLYELAPRARCRTAYANYGDKEGFLNKYPQTAYRNIGSQFAPCMASEACWCEE